MPAPRSALCLNMIVRNESAIIERCLAAAVPAIAAWVVCDTGSTDDTRERIVRFFESRGVPGELHAIAFENFEQARNEALRRARASPLAFDYLLLADADMELVIDDPEFTAHLSAPSYALRQQSEISYCNTRLVRRDVPARYVGVTHEYLDTGAQDQPLTGAWFRDHACGANRAGKFQRDIRLLEGALATDPHNARHVFYLAQSLKDAGEQERALERYRQRIAMGGWDEEVWYSHYQIARVSDVLGRPSSEVSAAYLAAYQARPQRAEPLVHLARWHRQRRQWALALLYARAAAALPSPCDRLFVEDAAYAWQALDELAIAAWYAGELDAGRSAADRLLAEQRFPPGERARIEANAGYYRAP